MPDLLALLTQSAYSLGAHRSYSATATHNLQNVNTPGYSRQRAELAAILPGERVSGAMIGRGVELYRVTQARDRFIERQMPAALSQSAASATESAVLRSVNALDPNGQLPESIGSFFGALRALSQNPGSAQLRQAAVGQAELMTGSFNRAAAGLDEARRGVDAKLTGVINVVNELASQMADLNKQIRLVSANGAPPNDLLDARQRVQDQLSELTGATVVHNANGDVNLHLPMGQVLVSSDRFATLSTIADPANNGHLRVQYNATDGSAPQNIPHGFGGEMGGLLAARDGSLKTAQTSLDTLAFDMANALNASHRAGYGLDGATGRDLLDPGTTSAGAALRLSVNGLIVADPNRIATASSAGTLPGDASNLQATIATEKQLLSSGANAADTLTRIISQFGSVAQRVESLASHDEASLRYLNTMRDSVSGVSIDEEMVNLTRAQRAFEAVAKVIQTTDQMLETLMSLK